MRGLRPPATVRVRLTALYGGLFLLAVTVLLVVVNLLLGRSLNHKVTMIAVSSRDAPPQGVVVPPPPGDVVYGRQPEDLPLGTPGRTAALIRDSALSYQWGVTFIAIVVLAVVAVVAGWWLAGRVLRPLHHITATARRLSLSNLDERIALEGPRDELKELADTFDAMLARLERAVESQRRFIANASHELRTPLAIQRAAIQIGLADASPEQVERMRGQLLEANRRSERLIDGLLTLARGERGLDAREPVRLDGIAEDAVEQIQPTAEQDGIAIRLDTRPLTVVGDAVLLTQLT